MEAGKRSQLLLKVILWYSNKITICHIVSNVTKSVIRNDHLSVLGIADIHYTEDH
jgi:hypothetical protein